MNYLKVIKIIVLIMVFVAGSFSYLLSQSAQLMPHNALEGLKFVVQNTDNDTFKVNMLNCMARIQWAADEFLPCKDNANQALSLAVRIGFKKGMRDAHDNLGEADFFLLNYNEAQDHFRRTIQISNDISDRRGVAYGYRQVAWVFQEMQLNEKALVYFDTSMVINQELKDTMPMCEILSRQAMIYTSMGDFQKAKMCHELANSLYQEMKNRSMNPVAMDRALLSNLYAQQSLSIVLALQEKQKRRLAYALSIFIFIIAGIIFYWYRIRKKLENQRALLSERLRISRDLHDEVGATLSGIVLYSHLAKSQSKNENGEMENSLNIVQDTASEMVNKLNDVVWLINPLHDNLEDLLQRLEEYAIRTSAAKNMNIKLFEPEHLENIILLVETRKNIYLICKEAINNAVKYSEGSMIELSIARTENVLEFTIKDNGIGFDHELVKRGNGLNNMQQRAEDIGAEIRIQKNSMSGTIVFLKCKITQMGYTRGA